MRLFTLTVDGDTDVGITLVGGTYHIMCTGDFGSGTLTPKVSPDAGTTKVAIQDSSGDVTFTAAGMVNFDVPPGYAIYLSLSGSTTPDLDVWVGGLDFQQL